jgi:hypothetical protein
VEHAIADNLAQEIGPSNPGISIKCACEPGTSRLVAAVQASLGDALESRGKLRANVLAIPGMSGKKYRLLINNLIERVDGASYLEIGTWAGSTFCSAIDGNKVRAVAIDNWSEFGGPAGKFLANAALSCTTDTKISILSEDFRSVRFDALGTFNVYLFDGPHELRDQFDGLCLAQICLADEFVYIVDDWNWEKVQEGTVKAIQHLKLTPLYELEIRTSMDGSHPAIECERSDWHNGYFVSVLKKPPK